MPTRDEEQALKEAVRQAALKADKSKKRAERLTALIEAGNKRQREYIESMRRANQALEGLSE